MGVLGCISVELLLRDLTVHETTEQGLKFRSGGGITAYSNPQKEYEELIEKVYLPVKEVK